MSVGKVNRKKPSLRVIHKATVLHAVHFLGSTNNKPPSTFLVREYLGLADSSYDMGQKLWGLKQTGFVSTIPTPSARGNLYKLTDKGSGFLALNTEHVQSRSEVQITVGLGASESPQRSIMDIEPIEPPAPQFDASANAAMDEIAPLLDQSVALNKALDDISAILAGIRLQAIKTVAAKEITTIRRFMPAVADLMEANNELSKTLDAIHELLPEAKQIKPQETTTTEEA